MKKIFLIVFTILFINSVAYSDAVGYGKYYSPEEITQQLMLKRYTEVYEFLMNHYVVFYSTGSVIDYYGGDNYKIYDMDWYTTIEFTIKNGVFGYRYIGGSESNVFDDRYIRTNKAIELQGFNELYWDGFNLVLSFTNFEPRYNSYILEKFFIKYNPKDKYNNGLRVSRLKIGIDVKNFDFYNKEGYLNVFFPDLYHSDVTQVIPKENPPYKKK